MALDTLDLARNLEAAGLSEEQARGLVRALQKHWHRVPVRDPAPVQAGGYVPGEAFAKTLHRTGNRLIACMVALMVPLYVLLAAVVVGMFSR
jgi:hypothetical protein